MLPLPKLKYFLSFAPQLIIYPKSDLKAFQQVEKLREDNRVDMYAEADYSEGTTTYMWITNKIYELAQNIVNEEKSKLEASISDSPKHLT